MSNHITHLTLLILSHFSSHTLPYLILLISPPHLPHLTFSPSLSHIALPYLTSPSLPPTSSPIAPYLRTPHIHLTTLTVVLPCVLLGLANSNRRNRYATSLLLESVLDKLHGVNTESVVHLFKEISRRSEECIADNQYIVQVIVNSFTYILIISSHVIFCKQHISSVIFCNQHISSIIFCNLLQSTYLFYNLL